MTVKLPLNLSKGKHFLIKIRGYKNNDTESQSSNTSIR